MNTINNNGLAPDTGQPPPEVQRSLDALYQRHKDFAEPREASTPKEEPSFKPRAAPKVSEPIPEGPQLTPEETRLLRHYRQNSAEITIFVNGVELTFDVVHVDRTETSICCLVRQAGTRCKIPRSEEVRIELEGQSYHTAFLGSWHPIDWLGVNIAVFPILPDSL
jgi:hypothetical protein